MAQNTGDKAVLNKGIYKEITLVMVLCNTTKEYKDIQEIIVVFKELKPDFETKHKYTSKPNNINHPQQWKLDDT